MSYEDELRAHQEHLRVGNTRAGRQYLDPRKLSEELPEPCDPPAAGDAGLTHDDVSAAIGELAGQAGVGFGEVNSLVRAVATGESVDELVLAVAQVADELSLGDGSGDDMVGLAASDYADPGLLREGHRRFPLDTPEKVSQSWHDLHEHWHEYAESDFDAMKAKIKAAAEDFGIVLHDPRDSGLSPEGTTVAGTAGHAAEDQREAVRDAAMVLGLTVTQAERDQLVKSGQALPGGDFPVHDARHLAAAKSQYKKRNLAGHSAAEVRAHINRNAKRLGLPGLDDDDHDAGHDEDNSAATARLTQGSELLSWPEAEVVRLTADNPDVFALTGGRDTADTVAARHPELFRKGSRRAGGRHPARSGRAVTSRTRAHSTDPDPMDAKQPAESGVIHPEVERLIKAHGVLMGVNPNTTYPVKRPEQREAEEVKARAGHGGSRSIPDLDRHSQRGSNTTWTS